MPKEKPYQQPVLMQVEWALRMFKESKTPEAVDVPLLLERVRVRLAHLEAAAPPSALDVAIADVVACFAKWDTTPDVALDIRTVDALHDLVDEWKRHRKTLSSVET